MHEKSAAFRTIGEQFKPRMHAAIEEIMASLHSENAQDVLGSGLTPLIGRGSLKALATFALYADVLRMVRDMVMADGEVSDEEVQVSFGLLSEIAAGFAQVRKEYGAFRAMTAEAVRPFLSQYGADAGLFGYANEATKWSGVELCRNIQDQFGSSGPLDAFGGALVEWAEQIAGSGGISAHEQRLLESLRMIIRCSQPTRAAGGDGASASSPPRSIDVEEEEFEVDQDDAAADGLLLERLLQAVNDGDVDAVREALEDGADIDHRYPEAGLRAPLHLAVASGNMSLVQWLTLLGADLEICDGQGNSPLAIARAAGNSWIAEFLEEQLASNADAGEDDEHEEDDEFEDDDELDEDDDDEAAGDDEDDEQAEADPLTKALNVTFGQMQWRAGNNEDCSDLLAEARSLIAQGADTTFLRNLAAILQALKVMP